MQAVAEQEPAATVALVFLFVLKVQHIFTMVAVVEAELLAL
jgi:hypothetical protein